MEELLFYLPLKAVKKVWELNNGRVFPKITFSVTKIEGLDNIYEAVDYALDCGYRSFDCSPRNDEEVNLGTALEELLPLYDLERKDVVLCTRVMPKNYGKFLTRESFTQSCENLKTDYIDIFLMDWPGGFKIDPESNENIRIRNETWNEIAALISSGGVKAGGVCHFNTRHLESLRKKSRLVPAVNQVEFHPHCPQIELLNYCNERNIQLMAACQKETVHPLMLEEPSVKKVANDLKKTPTQVVLKMLPLYTKGPWWPLGGSDIFNKHLPGVRVILWEKIRKRWTYGEISRWILNKGVGVVVQSLNRNKIAENIELFDFILGKADMDLLNGIHNRERYLRSSVSVI